jgi:hypothetical protein
MSFQSLHVTERHITHITVIWSLLRMNGIMALQIILNWIYFVTNIASKWMYFTKQALNMDLKITFYSKCFFTHITAIWTIMTVYVLKMRMWNTPTAVGHITHTARKQMLSSMQALMFLQITPIIEWLITHIAWVLRLLFVRAPVTAEGSTKSKWLVTHVTCVLIPFGKNGLLFR